jgi:hypothetical protein
VTVTVDAIRSAVVAADEEAKNRKLNRQMRIDLTMRKIEELYENAPSVPVPELVGLGEATEIVLGSRKRKGYLSRLRNRGEIPAPVAELSSGPVFVKSEIEEAARRIRREREERERARGG